MKNIKTIRKPKTANYKKSEISFENENNEIENRVIEKISANSEKKSPLVKIMGFLLLLTIGIVGFMKINMDRMVKIKTKTIPEIVGKLTQGAATVKEVTGLKLVSGVYEFEMNLESNGTVNKYTSYISKDGKLFFVQGTKVDDLNKQLSTADTKQKKLTCDDVNKIQKGKLTAFVVADCPYGIQMQRVMNKAISEDNAIAANLDVKYIGSIIDGKITSMHGDAEASENLRQICIREEQKEKYWPYVSCYMKKPQNSSACLSQTSVNQTQLKSCMTDPKKGLAYAGKDFELAKKYGIGSSPTLLANDSQIVSEFDFGGRTANALKTLVCCSSSDKPGFCEKDFSSEVMAASFSETDTGSADNSAADCN